MILLPIGHENATVRRLPWVTFVLIGLCAAAFLLAGRAHPLAGDDVRVARDVGRAFEYWAEHPYLELAPELRQRLPDEVGARQSRGPADIETDGETASISRPDDPETFAVEQRRLNELAARALGSLRGHALHAWGLVPARPHPLAFVTHMFLHAGWLHLLGNLLMLYLAGPLIEDVWGRPLYASFYLACGLVAALFHLATAADSQVPMIGASGAIAGVMGACLVRLGTTRIRFFYMIGLVVRGTFTAPAWVMLPLWFAIQVAAAIATRDAGGGGVAYWAHVGGFAAGATIAIAVGMSGFERRVLAPALADRVELSVMRNDALELGLAALVDGNREQAFAHFTRAVRDEPGNPDASAALWEMAVDMGRVEEAAPTLVTAIAFRLRENRTPEALDLWSRLLDRVPGIFAEPALLVRLAQGLAERQDRERCRVTLRRAIAAPGPPLPAPLLLRAARAARFTDAALARDLVTRLSDRPDLDTHTRDAANRLAAELASLPILV